MTIYLLLFCLLWALLLSGLIWLPLLPYLHWKMEKHNWRAGSRIIITFATLPVIWLAVIAAVFAFMVAMPLLAPER